MTGTWAGGRVGTFRGLRTGAAYGGTAFTAKGATAIGSYGKDGPYRPMLVEILKFFQTGVAPVDPKETIEIYAFMEAADESKRQGGKPVTLDAIAFEKHAVKSDLPLLVDFWASWCGPCRMMAPAFEAAAVQLEPRVRLGKLDTEAEPGIAGRYHIQGIPCLILFRKGREVARVSGAMPTGQIVQWASQALAQG